ncbi:MAG: hypothetical protein Q9227_005004 [Pyrenula ochraceoflavens]
MGSFDTLPGNVCTRLDGGNLPPLAIVGFSFRFPQEAVTTKGFWDMLIKKRCASTETPSDRWHVDAHYHPDNNRTETLSIRAAHYMTGDLAAFDAPFFSSGAAETEAMDPAQRLTLETAYRAFENAGVPIERLAGTKTSVYSGFFSHDYATVFAHDPDFQAKYRATGTAPNMIANRVSWFFDLKGPSANVDTACSSSLMALDLVCQSIWTGDATMGLACGSNVMLTPELGIALDNLGMLGPSGRCFSFDHRANGYARGEGFGALVVKPLDAALQDSDTIRAVIRSSGSNQDGKTPGVTQPSREAQADLILNTYNKGGLDLCETRYVEAHGTGTPVGDPIEAGAIGSVFRKFRSAEDPLYLGSVKSNIGHLEGASGVAGVIKAVLALEAGVIPPNSNFEKLNPKIDAEFWNIKIASKPVSWPTNGLRRASVQSFGFGGANSHIVLDDAYNFLRMRGLAGNHNTVPKPPITPGDFNEILSNNDSSDRHDLSNGLANGHHSPDRMTNGQHSPNGIMNGHHSPSNGMMYEHQSPNGMANGTHLPNGSMGERSSLNGYSTGCSTPNGYSNKYSSANGLSINNPNNECTLPRLLVWSTVDEGGTKRLKEKWKEHFTGLDNPKTQTVDYIRDLAHTLATRRSQFPWRTFTVAKDVRNISSLVDDLPKAVRAGSNRKLAFVFSGVGNSANFDA